MTLGVATVAESPFDRDELDRRVTATCAEFERLGADVMLVTDQDDMLYLTGARELGGLMLMALLVTADRRIAFVGRAVDAVALQGQAQVDYVYGYNDGLAPEEVLAQAIAECASSTAVVAAQLDSPTLSVRSLDRLREQLPDARWEDGTRIVWNQRLIKSAAELELMREVSRINTGALERALTAVEIGVTDSHVAAELFAAMLEGGSHPMCYFMCSSGPNTAVVHSTYDNRRLLDGDHVHFEFSASRWRYHVPIMRTVTVGKRSADVERLHEGAQAALERAMDTIRAGVTSDAVDTAANAVLEEMGLREFHHHRTGYSVGIATGVQWPEGHVAALRAGDPLVLREGMVFHLPLVLFEPGVAGAGISETVLVTADRAEPLTRYERDLLQR